MQSDTIETAFGDFMRAFEAFKDSNDERLGQLERRRRPTSSPPTASIASTARSTSTSASSTSSRSNPCAPTSAGPGVPLRRGPPAPRRLRRLHPQGRGRAPARSGIQGPLGRLRSRRRLPRPRRARARRQPRRQDVSPIRAIAGIRQVSGSVYKKPFAISGAESGWVAETAARPETDTPTLAELSFPTMELYAMPAATSALLDDSAVNIDEWIAEEVRDAFAQQEGTAFVTGNGTNKPKGFLDYTKVDNATWSWGNIGFIKTGVNGAFASTNPGDKLIDLVYAVKSGYRGNGTFVFNRATQSVIRKMKDGDGNYLWQPAAKAGDASMLMGYPVAESEDMPVHGDRQLLGGLRRLPPRLPDRRPRRHPRAARPLQLQALRAVLHHQARRRRRPGLRRHQAPQVRRVKVIPEAAPRPSGSQAIGNRQSSAIVRLLIPTAHCRLPIAYLSLEPARSPPPRPPARATASGTAPPCPSPRPAVPLASLGNRQ